MTISPFEANKPQPRGSAIHPRFPKTGSQLQLMSHAVVGYPSLDENLFAIEGLVNAGVSLIELQVPFSDPVADGPTLATACHQALKTDGSLQATLDLAKVVCKKFPTTGFIVMSYLNPLYRYGLEKFFNEAAAYGIIGLIVPDWPVEELEPFLPRLDQLGLAPILMVSPNTPDNRIKRIAQAARGMLYVVSRMGVTGSTTHWDQHFDEYLDRIRSQTQLPLAVGFGVRGLEDLQALSGKTEVAAFCSKYIEWQSTLGSEQAATKMAELIKDLNSNKFSLEF